MDNLSTVDRLAGPNVSFIKRSHCIYVVYDVYVHLLCASSSALCECVLCMGMLHLLHFCVHCSLWHFAFCTHMCVLVLYILCIVCGCVVCVVYGMHLSTVCRCFVWSGPPYPLALSRL